MKWQVLLAFVTTFAFAVIQPRNVCTAEPAGVPAQESALPTADNYTARINDKIQIELLAVSNPVWESVWQQANNDQSAGHDRPEYWWRPDGERIEKPSFKRGRFTGGQFRFDCLIRVTGTDDFGLVAAADQASNINEVDVCRAVDSERNPLPGLYIVGALDFPRRGQAEKTTLCVGVASGPWTCVQTWAVGDWPEWANDPESHILSSGCGGLIELPHQTGDGIQVDLAHRLSHEEIRLTATDQQDKIYIASQADRGNGDGISRKLCTFKGLSLKDLKSISLETRDYQWAQIPNVVLEPEHVLPYTSFGTVKKMRGKQAPEFLQAKGWMNGPPIKMADLRGKVVMLNFFNYGCGSCLAEMPQLMDLHDRYAKQGLVVVGVHADMIDSVEAMQAKLKPHQEQLWKGRAIPFPVVLDGGGQVPIQGSDRMGYGATTAAYGVLNFPTTILIDKQGKVQGEVSIGDKDLQDRIEKLLSSQ